MNREAVSLARLYHIVKTDPPLSAFKQYESIVRTIVEVVHAAVMMEDDEDGNNDKDDDEKDEDPPTGKS